MILLLAVLLFVLYWYYSWHRNGLSGLPTPKYYLPVIGHVEVLLAGSTNPVDHMWNLYKKYSRGGIMVIHIFGVNNVLVGDFDAVKLLLNHPAVQNRAIHADMEKCRMFNKLHAEDRKNKGAKGVIFNQGPEWADQRRFTLRTLKDFGFGKSSMEEMIQDEVNQLVIYLKETAQGPVDVSHVFNLPVINGLWRVCTGESFEYTDPKLIKIVEMMTRFFQLVGDKTVMLIVNFPLIFKWFPTLLERDVHITVNQAIMKMIEESISEHQATLDVNEPRDFIDSYLIEVGNTTDPSSSFYGENGISSLTNTLCDLFLAGSETTSTTLTWAVLYMAREPHIQRKVQAEIDLVVGNSRTPLSTDRSLMPYTDAVIHEVMRCGNIFPHGVFRTSSEPIKVNGITVPAFTMINPLMAEILKGDNWENGLTFNPDRFLSKEGAFTKDEHLIPFSLGKRQCLGLTLAKLKLFLFFTGLLQQFTILPEEEGVRPLDEGRDGVTQLPLPFKVILKSRQSDQ